MQDFLNPRSMITPGAAGGVVMLVANTLAMNFGIAAEWTAMAVSAVISILVVARYAGPLWERGCYFVLNGLIIFCMATGAATVGYVATASEGAGGSESSDARRHIPAEFTTFAGLIGEARAQSDSDIDELCEGNGATLDERTRALCRIVREQREMLATEPRTAAPALQPRAVAPTATPAGAPAPAPAPPQPKPQPEPKKPKFFKPWLLPTK